VRLKGDNIFWDLDGVLRNLTYNFQESDVDSWDRVNGSGKTVVEHVEENLSVLVDAPEYDYLSVARQFSPVHIVSAQPDSWRPYTSTWIDKHIPGARIKYLLDTQHKLKYLESGTRILVEDCPLYSDYRHIILIDRPYNKDVECSRRVHNPEELMDELRRFLHGN
jgi:hypothetical protein